MLDRVVVERHKTYRSYYQIITQDIGASSLEAFWMSISFLLAAVAFQPAHTAMSDIFGRKLVLYVCCLFFVIGLVVFGTAESPTTIIIGRTIQGFGGGGLEALSEVILTDITTLKERPLYLGIMSFFWAGAAVAGPPIGGALAEYTTWRWLAWILLPFIGVALILIHPTLTLRQDRNSIMLKLTRVDWLGLLLSVSAATMVLFAITAGGQIFPWSSVQILTPLCLGIICTILFCYFETKTSSPMLSPEILATRTVTAAMFGALLHGIATWCMLYFAPLFFESVLLHTPIEAAVDGLSFGLTATPFAILTAFMIEFSRRYLWSIGIGWALATIGSGCLIALSSGTAVVPARALFIPAGIGLGMLYPSLAMPIQAGVHVDRAGTATGMLVFFRNLGSTIGVGVGSSIFTTQFQRNFGRANLEYSSFGMRNAQNAIDRIPGLRGLAVSPFVMQNLLQVYSDSFKAVCVFMTVVTGIGLLTTLFIKELSFETEEEGRQALDVRMDDLQS